MFLKNGARDSPHATYLHLLSCPRLGTYAETVRMLTLSTTFWYSPRRQYIIPHITSLHVWRELQREFTIAECVYIPGLAWNEVSSIRTTVSIDGSLSIPILEAFINTFV